MLMMLMEQSQAPVAPAARRPSPGAAMSDAAAMAAASVETCQFVVLRSL